MGSETCLENTDEWCSLTFRAKKSCLRQYLRVLRASWRKRGVFSGFRRSPRAVWELVGPTRTLNDKVMTHLLNIGPFYGIPWKYFIVAWRFLRDCSKISCPLWWRYYFHIYIDQCQECPFVLGIHAHELHQCYPAKTRRIRHIGAGFSSIYGQMRLPGS